jgi:Flp pilus assembly protein TadD
MSFIEGLKEYKAGRYEKAIELFQLVTEKDYGNHKAWNALGVCYSFYRKYEDADRCFRTAIAIFPQSAVYFNNRRKNRRKMLARVFEWEARYEVFSQPGS